MLQSPIAADGFATQRETHRTGQACIHRTSFIGRVPFTFPWLGWKHFSHGVWHRKYHKAEPHNAQCHIFSLLDSGRGVAKLLTAAVQGTEFTDSVTWHLPPLPPKHFERDATGFIRITPHWKQFSKRQVAVSCYCYEYHSDAYCTTTPFSMCTYAFQLKNPSQSLCCQIGAVMMTIGYIIQAARCRDICQYLIITPVRVCYHAPQEHLR